MKRKITKREELNPRKTNDANEKNFSPLTNPCPASPPA